MKSAWLPLCALSLLAGCRLFFVGETPCSENAHCSPTVRCIDGLCTAGTLEPPPRGPTPPVFGRDAGAPDDAGVDAGLPPIDAGLDAGPDAGPPLPDAGSVDAGSPGCDAHVEPLLPVRHNLTLTSQAEHEIPAGYPLRLDVSGLDVTGDLRLYRCDGAAQVPAPLAPPRDGPHPYFRAVAPIAVGATDDAYILYSGGSAGASAAPGVPDARVVSVNIDTPVTVASQLTAVDVDLPETEPGERWLLLATYAVTNDTGFANSFRPLFSDLRIDGGLVQTGRVGVMQQKGRPRTVSLVHLADAGASRVELVLRNSAAGNDLCTVEELSFQAILLARAPLVAQEGSTGGFVEFDLPAADGVILAHQRLSWTGGSTPTSRFGLLTNGIDEVAVIDFGLEPDGPTPEPAMPQLWASRVDAAEGDQAGFFVTGNGESSYRFFFLGLDGNFDVTSTTPSTNVTRVGSAIPAVQTSLTLPATAVPHERVVIAAATMGRDSDNDTAVVGETRISLDGAVERLEELETEQENTEAHHSVSWSGYQDSDEASLVEISVRLVAGNNDVRYLGGSIVELRYFEVEVTGVVFPP